MTVFLTPDGAPFYAGTYFPPTDRFGMPGFPMVLRALADFYRDHRDEAEEQAAAFRDHYAEQRAMGLTLPADFAPTEATVSSDVLRQAANALVAQMDTVHGGFGRAPKFPHPMGLEFLLRIVTRVRSDRPGEALDGVGDQLVPLLRLTLDKMAAGGIYDQVGGGFHRYSTDAIWLVPHFEKMLYDNALLAPVYLHAWQLTGEARYRRIGEETLDYVLREMTDPLGGFYSTQDADSEGEEGTFYLWTPEQLRAALKGAQANDAQSLDVQIAERVWGVSARGNFEGRSILHLARTPSEVATELGLPEEQVREAIERARATLYAVRTQRVWPARDDKALAAWNGWMLRALAESGRILDRADYRAAAIKNADFLLDHMIGDGRLQRTWRNGAAKIAAYLEDYGAVINGLLSVYEMSGDERYFTAARHLTDELLSRFWDETTGAFFDTASDAEALIGRPRELTDNATPSGTSLACEALLRLFAFTADARYPEYAVRLLVPLAPAMAQQPSAFGHLLCALDDLIGPFDEVALIGAPDAPSTLALERALSSQFRPRMVLAQATPEQAARSAVPLLAGRGLMDGKPAVFVCQGFVCRQPVTVPESLRL
jgi:uncharacterized protein YyaL (SSP411 family)